MLNSAKSMDRLRDFVRPKRPAYPVYMSQPDVTQMVPEPRATVASVPPIPEHLRAIPASAQVARLEAAFMPPRRSQTALVRPPTPAEMDARSECTACVPLLPEEFRAQARQRGQLKMPASAPDLSGFGEPGPQEPPPMPQRARRPAARAPQLSLVDEAASSASRERRSVMVQTDSNALNRAALAYAARVLNQLAQGQPLSSAGDLTPKDIDRLYFDASSVTGEASGSQRSRSDSATSSNRSAKPRRSGVDN